MRLSESVDERLVVLFLEIQTVRERTVWEDRLDCGEGSVAAGLGVLGAGVVVGEEE
jgi:hypothetical protein